MNIEQTLQEAILRAIKDLYGADVDASSITLQKTKREFTGHYTLVTFPLLRVSRKKPEETGQDIGTYLVENSEMVTQFNVIKGFLNLTIAPAVWIRLLEDINRKPDYGFVSVADEFFVSLRIQGAKIRVLLSDVTAALDWPIADEAAEMLGVDIDDLEEIDDIEPAGDLTLLADFGSAAT